MLTCTECGVALSAYHMCDDDPINPVGKYCTGCFLQHPCRTFPHRVGCETMAFISDESDNEDGKS